MASNVREEDLNMLQDVNVLGVEHEENESTQREAEGKVWVKPDAYEGGMDRLFASVLANGSYGEKSSARRELLDFAEKILMDSEIKTERREAVLARKVLQRTNPLTPAELLESVPDQEYINTLEANHPAWLMTKHPHHTFDFVEYTLHLRGEAGNKTAWLRFESRKPLKAGFTKFTGISLDHDLQLPSLEVLVKIAKQVHASGHHMREFFEQSKLKPWGLTRNMANFLYRFVRQVKDTVIEVDDSKVTTKEIFASRIRDILEASHVSSTVWRQVGNALGGKNCLVVWDLEQSPVEMEEKDDPVAIEANVALEHKNEQGDKTHHRERKWNEDVAEDSTHPIVDLFLKEGAILDLFDGSTQNPHTGRKHRRGALLKNILNVDKWSNPRRPTNMVQTALAVGLAKGQAWEAVRAVFEEILAKSSYHESIEERGRSLRKTSWVGKDGAEFFTHGLHRQVNIVALQKRILEPLDLVAVPVSADGNLCMVRTFAFLILLVTGRLPPFTWRLTACLAFCAALLLGALRFTNTAIVQSASFDSLRAAIWSMCGDDVNIVLKYGATMIDIVCGQLSGSGPVKLSEQLNMSLKDLVLEFFAKHNSEKKDVPFTFEGGLDYQSLQIIPVLTGRPFLVIRTVGDVTENGEISIRKTNERDATHDTIAVFDVFNVTHDGIRQFGTYGSLKEAQENLGMHTKYMAFWTAMEGGISHLDPIVCKNEYARLRKYKNIAHQSVPPIPRGLRPPQGTPCRPRSGAPLDLVRRPRPASRDAIPSFRYFGTFSTPWRHPHVPSASERGA
eukprot:scaffold703_cov374-Pavlova_lutheri.AAC.3